MVRWNYDEASMGRFHDTGEPGAVNGAGGAASVLAAGECEGEGERENQMGRWEAHGRALGLDVAHDSLSWPGRSGRRRRAATHVIVEA